MNTLPATPLWPTTSPLKAIAQSSGLVLLFIHQASIPLYEVYGGNGELMYLSIAEQFDDPAGWHRRTGAEQDAMMTLALDEYHGKMTWDEIVTIPVSPA